MLYLVTGTPGASKTINTIKFVAESDQFKEVNGKERQVYYFGIRDLSPDFGWIELTEEEALKWYDLPSGSVIIFDEAYNIFPVKHPGKSSPEHVTRLATHRHQGFDIFLICQKVNGQLDTFVRGLVGRHQHYARIMGSKMVNRFSWDQCVTNPDSRSIRKDANKASMSIDKKYFGKYHSADEHTHTTSIPWRLLSMILIGVLVIGWACYSVYNHFVPDAPEQSVTASQSQYAGEGGPPPPPPSQRNNDDLTFAELHNPEIPGLPWSAPIYKEQTQAQSWPRPAACILRKKSGKCSCFTQQATRLSVSQEFCLHHVHEGFYDWTRPDFARVAYVENAGGQGVDSHYPGARAADAPRLDMGGNALAPAPDTSPRRSSRAILIDHTPPPPMQVSPNRLTLY